MIKRTRQIQGLKRKLSRSRIVAILGARQVGKTTLARQFLGQARGATHRFDLEDPADLARLEDPMLALSGLRGLVVIDEVQHRPELFPVLRVLADRPRGGARFILLGSASPELVWTSSETLAGRIAYHELRGFALDELAPNPRKQLWLRGGFPSSLLARSVGSSFEWRQDFVRTFLERDIPRLGIGIPAATLRRFWSMLAHYHGQVWNASEFGRSFGVADTTVRRYLEILAGSYLVRVLQPFHENLKKRQVKAPKIYLNDSGLLHALLGLETQRDLEGHPKVGASWEGYAVEQVVQRLGARPEELFFWATHSGAELDLLVVRGRKRVGFEFKRTVSPQVTRSMRIACEDLRLDRLHVIHAGEQTFPLAKGIRALAMDRLLDDLEAL